MPVLTYHHVDMPNSPLPQSYRGLWVAPDLFLAQMAQLFHDGYQSISPDQLKIPLIRNDFSCLPKKWVLITFDDGWIDNVLHALPILKEFHFSATLFLSTANLRDFSDKASSTLHGPMMSIADVQKWLSAGCFVESHTCTHPHLNEISRDDVYKELLDSKKTLMDLFNVSSNWLCYPYGHFNREVAQIANDVGYLGAFSTIRDNRFSASQRFWIPRVQVMNDTSPNKMAYLDSWLYHFIHFRKNKKRFGEFL